MWDIGGQESLRQAWSTYYSSSNYLIMVVDSTDRERLDVIKGELYNMLEHEVRMREGKSIGERIFLKLGSCNDLQCTMRSPTMSR